MVPLKDVFLKIHLYAGLDRFKSILFFKTIFFLILLFFYFICWKLRFIFFSLLFLYNYSILI
jgi:hypothetical protein